MLQKHRQATTSKNILGKRIDIIRREKEKKKKREK